MADRFILERPALIFGQPRTLQAAANLTLQSRVGARPRLIYRFSEHRKKITVLCSSRQIVFSAFHRDVA
jgi:hypothetical protein